MGLARDFDGPHNSDGGSNGNGDGGEGKSDAATAKTQSGPLEMTPGVDLPGTGLAPALEADFDIIKLLGCGGMGRVYMAIDRKLRRTVALKCVPKAGSTSTADLAGEAQLMARIRHDNVVTVYGVREHGDMVYIVSEYIEGESLAEMDKPVPWDKARDWGRQLAQGLAAAHASDVLHRDIKPANVMIEADTGKAVLIDFGVGKLMTAAAQTGLDGDAVGHSETAPGVRPGTRRYQAPELWQGERASESSDIYALGLVLSELCTGEMPPAPGDPAAQGPLYLHHGDIDARFVRIINGCLAREPAERYESADAVAQALVELASAPAVMRNPYRGLEMFCAQHRGMFFGREGDIARVVERVQTQPLVLLVGDSGVGKSSLARAGVLPRLAGDDLASGDPGGSHSADDSADRAMGWRTCHMVPGHRPLTTLIQLLAWAEISMTELPSVQTPEAWHDRAVADAFVRALMTSLEGRKTRLLLFVDQLEELITISDDAQAEAVQYLWAAMLDAAGDRIRMLAAVRGDYLTAISAMSELGPRIQDRIYLLRPLEPAAIRDAIAEPARKMGIVFSPESLIDRLHRPVVKGQAGLPLLQFVLAMLWDQRDADGDQITEASLERIGDVAGALARHADGVIETLRGRGQGTIARRILIQLVSRHHPTRLRCTRNDLVGTDAAAWEVLDSLVKQRLITAHGGDGDGGYVLAHEALLSEWPQLRAWLDSERNLTAIKDELAQAVDAWENAGRTRDALGRRALIRRAARIPYEDLSPAEAAFFDASKHNLWLMRWGMRAAAVVIIGLIVAVYANSWYQLKSRVDAHLVQARGHLERAHELHAAYADAGRQTRTILRADDDDDGWRPVWQKALALYPQVTAAYGDAIQAAEAGFSLDAERGDTVALLARALDGRARLAKESGQRQQHAETVRRLLMLAPSYVDRWPASVAVTVETVPAGAEREIWRYNWHNEGPFELVPAAACPSNRTTCELAPGSYLVIVPASPGYAEIRYPVVVSEQVNITIARPRVEDVPAGYVFVPAGSYMRGYGQVPEDEPYRTWHQTLPLHQRRLDAFLIGTHEVRFRDWLAFVDACASGACPGIAAPARRIDAAFDDMRLIVERAGDGDWHIIWRPSSTGPVYRARGDQPIVYEGRQERARQVWLDTPVSGLSWHDVQGYLAWLRTHHGIAGADLCTEAQWERAARGADARLYPHGNGMRRIDDDGAQHMGGNIDITYGQEPAAFGPDVVGSYVDGRSPFGVLDMAGNIAELTRPGAGHGHEASDVGKVAVRGGAFYYATVDGRVFNRWHMTAHQRLPIVGFRVCATVPDRG